MFQKQTCNCIYLHQKETKFQSKSYEIKRIGCGFSFRMTKNEQILCLDYKLEKMNKHKDFQWPH
jgi:hypothetical protein